MIRVLTTAGINPRRRGHSPTSYILKLHPLNTLTQSALETLFRSSRLRGKCDALLVVDLSASLAAGTHWEVDADGMYCSNDVPIQPAYLHSAYTDNMGQLTQTWGGYSPRASTPTPGPHPPLVPPILSFSYGRRPRFSSGPPPPQPHPSVKFIQLRSLGISKTETHQETLN